MGDKSVRRIKPGSKRTELSQSGGRCGGGGGEREREAEGKGSQRGLVKRNEMKK